MRPAVSVILLTTLIGAGQGLFLAVYAVDVLGGAGVRASVSTTFLAAGGLAAGALAALGLVASFFHLGRPERAWRAVAMWRTSWLSREVIVLPVFIAGVTMYGIAHSYSPGLVQPIGLVSLVACIGLFYCTAMIYISLKFLQEWATYLTLLNFTVLGLASGATLAVAMASVLAPSLIEIYVVAAITLTVAGFVSRVASLVRNARLVPKSSTQSATGLRGSVVQRSRGFTATAFNTKEFFHGRSGHSLNMVKWGFLLFAFPFPVALLIVGMSSKENWLLFGAFVVQFSGLIAERWFFFAQATHPQNLYYQAVS